FSAKPGAELRIASVPVQPSGSALAVLLIFTGLAGASCFCFWRWRRKGRAWRKDLERRAALDRGAGAIWYQRVALSSLASVGAMLSPVALLPMRIDGWKASPIDLALELLSVIATGGVLAATGHAWLAEDEAPPAVGNGEARRTLGLARLGGSVILLL